MDINLKGVVLCIVGLAALVTLYFFYSAKEINDEDITLVTVDTSEDWGDYVVRALTNKNIKKNNGFVDVSGVQIFKREFVDTSRTPYGTILLLHGMKFTSELWMEIASLEVTANVGYRCVTVDMPGTVIGRLRTPVRHVSIVIH